MTSKMNILVVAAHPDDEVLGMGGTIARHTEEGDIVSILILSDGVTSRQEREKRFEKEIQERYAAAQEAAEILGAEKPALCHFPDNQFDTVSLLSIAREIEKEIKICKPHIIYTHHGGDVNIDHRRTLEAVEAAVRPMDGNTIEEVRSFEVPSSSEWNFTRTPFRPNIFTSLTDLQLEKKIAAIKAYDSEMRPFPHPRSAQYVRALAQVRGGQSGHTAAEAFALVYRRI
jgi:LmbE family N-acetylglucosaminyl deacetylase